jgi:hypothetical protein
LLVLQSDDDANQFFGFIWNVHLFEFIRAESAEHLGMCSLRRTDKLF